MPSDTPVVRTKPLPQQNRPIDRPATPVRSARGAKPCAWSNPCVWAAQEGIPPLGAALARCACPCAKQLPVQPTGEAPRQRASSRSVRWGGNTEHNPMPPTRIVVVGGRLTYFAGRSVRARCRSGVPETPRPEPLRRWIRGSGMRAGGPIGSSGMRASAGIAGDYPGVGSDLWGGVLRPAWTVWHGRRASGQWGRSTKCRVAGSSGTPVTPSGLERGMGMDRCGWELRRALCPHRRGTLGWWGVVRPASPLLVEPGPSGCLRSRSRVHRSFGGSAGLNGKQASGKQACGLGLGDGSSLTGFRGKPPTGGVSITR